MALHFEPLVPAWVLSAAVLLYALTAVRLYRRAMAAVPPRYRRMLVIANIVAVGALIVALAGPTVRTRTPDRTDAEVIVLADATGSMAARDCGGRSRLEVLTAVLRHGSALRRVIRQACPGGTFHAFAGSDLRRIDPDAGLGILPGNTDIDASVLRALEDARRADRVAAVVLLSDGVDNVGAGLLKAVAACRAAGVPISCIGIGDSSPQRDVGVAWTRVPKTVEKGKPARLAVRVTRSFSGPAVVRLAISEGARSIRNLSVRFEADEKERMVEVEHTPFVAGFHTYRARAAAVEGEENILNNVDFAGFPVTEPDVFRVLFFSANLDWNYKFLKRFADEHEQLELDARIRTGPGSWFVRGPEDDNGSEAAGLPSAEELSIYNCLIVSVAAVNTLDEGARARLRTFVEQRGGGLIFTGITDAPPADLLRLMPLKELPARTVRVKATPLDIRPSRVFASGTPGPAVFAAHLSAPGGSTIYALEPHQVKPGATTAATLSGAGWVALAVHLSGAGKVAYLNLTDTWRWAMENDRGGRDYAAFWGRLIAWMASSARERLTVRPYAARLTMGQPHTFRVDLLDSSYQPENGANVTCSVETPDGGGEVMRLFPDVAVDGRYTGPFIGRQRGEYRLTFTARVGDVPVQERTIDYLFTDSSPEVQPSPMARRRLQNLARGTGGRYWDYGEVAGIRRLPLSVDPAYTTQSRRWLDESWVLLLVVLALLPHWYLRRRIGLR